MDSASCPNCGNVINRVVCPNCGQTSDDVATCTHCYFQIAGFQCARCGSNVMTYDPAEIRRARMKRRRDAEMNICCKRAAILIPVSLIMLILMVFLLGGF